MVSERLDQELGQREQLHPFTSLSSLPSFVSFHLLTVAVINSRRQGERGLDTAGDRKERRKAIPLFHSLLSLLSLSNSFIRWTGQRVKRSGMECTHDEERSDRDRRDPFSLSHRLSSSTPSRRSTGKR